MRNTLETFLLGKLNQIEEIKDIVYIQTVRDWIQEYNEKFNQVELPNWMTREFLEETKVIYQNKSKLEAVKHVYDLAKLHMGVDDSKLKWSKDFVEQVFEKKGD